MTLITEEVLDVLDDTAWMTVDEIEAAMARPARGHLAHIRINMALHTLEASGRIETTSHPERWRLTVGRPIIDIRSALL